MRWHFEIVDLRWVPFIFFLLGLVFLAVGGGWVDRTKDFKQSAARTEGVVIDLVITRSGTYAPVFEFDDASGVRHRIVSATASNPPAFEVSERVRVLYQPGHPEGARIDSFLELWLGPLIFLVLGTAFSGFGGGVGWFLWREALLPHTGRFSGRPRAATHRP